jgi:hypothetical protein
MVESIESVGWGVMAYKLPSLKFSIGGVQIVEIQKSESFTIILIFIQILKSGIKPGCCQCYAQMRFPMKNIEIMWILYRL